MEAAADGEPLRYSTVLLLLLLSLVLLLSNGCECYRSNLGKVPSVVKCKRMSYRPAGLPVRVPDRTTKSAPRYGFACLTS